MQSEYEAIKKLRKGSIYLAIGTFLLGILGVITSLLIITAINVFQPYNGHSSTNEYKIIEDYTILLFVELLGLITGVIGLRNIRSGFKILLDMGKDVRNGYSGAKIYLVSMFLSVIGFILLPIGLGLILFLIGTLFTLIGNILVGTGFYKVGRLYNDNIIKISGFISAVPISVISFIGYIMIYIGLGKMKMLSPPKDTSPHNNQTQNDTSQSFNQLSNQTTNPPVYQIGQGILKNDGSVHISLYSSTEAIITSAKIDNMLLETDVIEPRILQPGQNEIMLKFVSPTSLTYDKIHKIILEINVNGEIIQIDAFINYTS